MEKEEFDAVKILSFVLEDSFAFFLNESANMQRKERLDSLHCEAETRITY